MTTFMRTTILPFARNRIAPESVPKLLPYFITSTYVSTIFTIPTVAFVGFGSYDFVNVRFAPPLLSKPKPSVIRSQVQLHGTCYQVVVDTALLRIVIDTDTPSCADILCPPLISRVMISLFSCECTTLPALYRRVDALGLTSIYTRLVESQYHTHPVNYLLFFLASAFAFLIATRSSIV